MKVLRSVLVAFSFGLMMSCSNSAGTAENGGENAAAVENKTPVEKAMDQVEAVIVKIEACKTKDEARDLKRQYRDATDAVFVALQEEVGENATPDVVMKAAEKYEKKSEELEKRYKEALKKLSD